MVREGFEKARKRKARQYANAKFVLEGTLSIEKDSQPLNFRGGERPSPDLNATGQITMRSNEKLGARKQRKNISKRNLQPKIGEKTRLATKINLEF